MPRFIPLPGLIDHARNRSAKVIEINVIATPATSVVDVSVQGASGKVLPELMAKLYRQFRTYGQTHFFIGFFRIGL